MSTTDRTARDRAARVDGEVRVTPSADDFVTALLTASRVLVGVSARSLAEVEETVTLSQFRTLVVLEGNSRMNLGQLAERLRVNSSSAMRMIDRLLVAGLVTRKDNPSNRREVLLGLSARGRRLVQTVTARRRAEIARIVTAIPAAGRAELIQALQLFAQAAAEPDPQAEDAAYFGW